MLARRDESGSSSAVDPSPSGLGSTLARVCMQEDINFLITNRLPRRWATLFMGWYSRLEIGWIRDVSIATWRVFATDLELSESRTRDFKSLNDCFTRQLKANARPIDARAEVVVSPCDAIVGEFGDIQDNQLIQAKGFPYRLEELLGSPELVARQRGGKFVTLRLKSSMYHRFHAPCAASIREVLYISGDTWNVNPIALKRVEKLFCRNERAVLDLRLHDRSQALTLVPVAAILVASIRLNFLQQTLDLRYRGPNRIPCDARPAKGDELGYFQHGSTIIVLANGGFEFCENIASGKRIRMGEPLLRGLKRKARRSPRAAKPDPVTLFPPSQVP